MAGYSSTPLPKKLGIKAGHRVLLDHAPSGFQDETLGPLPDCQVNTRAARKPYDVIVAFKRSISDLDKTLAGDIGRIDRSGSLWIAWPKKSSGVATDLDENIIRERALAAGVVDVKVCAIDEIYSGLKLVYRLKDR